jgi:peroxiredoxin
MCNTYRNDYNKDLFEGGRKSQKTKRLKETKQMNKQTDGFTQKAILLSNVFLFVAVVGLFLYVQRVQSQINTIFSTLISQTNSIEQIAQEYEGIQAPNFDLQRVGSDQRVSFIDFQGESVLLAFTWTDCIYCRAMYPELIEFSEKYPDIRVIMISRGTTEGNQELVTANDFPFLVLQGEETVYTSYSVPGTPFFYHVNSQGYIQDISYCNTLEDFENILFEEA